MAKAWLITGGSSGLGLSLGRTVLKKGATAVLTTRNVAKAQKAAPDIESSGGKWLQLDYSDFKVEQIVKDAVEQLDVDVIVNNAAYAAVGAVEDCSMETIRAQYEANLVGPIRIIQAVIPIFRERKSGTIANIGSSASYSGMAGNGIYGSTKAAIRTVTESLTLELAPFGIRVLLFEPGIFRTNFGGGAEFFGPGTGYSEAYKGGPVDHVVSFLRNLDPKQAPGNPVLAALRMYEVVTKTGMGSDERFKDHARIPLGSDTYDAGSKRAKEWGEVAEATKEISTSTDFKE